MARRLLTGMLLLAIVTSVPASAATAAESEPLQQVQHIVVIYQENHSFDNLYGGWEGVDGLRAADAAHTDQVGQAGAPYTCLLQNDAEPRPSPPLTANCTDTTTAAVHEPLPNAPFAIDGYIPRDRDHLPPPGSDGLNPGGCTRDLVHHYYQEPYQLNNGAQNRYVTGSDAVGPRDGDYDTTRCRSTSTCTRTGTRRYAMADNVLPGGVRRLVPEPPVAHRSGDAGVAERAQRRHGDDALDASTPTACRRATRCIARPQSATGR